MIFWSVLSEIFRMTKIITRKGIERSLNCFLQEKECVKKCSRIKRWHIRSYGFHVAKTNKFNVPLG